MSLSPETSHQVGHIPELVHIIGDFLRGDDDFQSISRMAVACKMYKDDLAEWMAEKKESYRRVKGDALIGMTDAQLRLVRETNAFGRLRGALSRAHRYQFAFARQLSGMKLTRMLNVEFFLGEYWDELQLNEFIASGMVHELEFLDLHSRDGDDTLVATYADFFTDLKAGCPALSRLNYTYHLGGIEILEAELSGVFEIDLHWLPRACDANIDQLSHVMPIAGSYWFISADVIFVIAEPGPDPEEDESSRRCRWTIALGSGYCHPEGGHLPMLLNVVLNLLGKMSESIAFDLSISFTAKRTSKEDTLQVMAVIQNDLPNMVGPDMSQAVADESNAEKVHLQKLSVEVLLDAKDDEAVSACAYKTAIDRGRGVGAEWVVERHDEKVAAYYAANS